MKKAITILALTGSLIIILSSFQFDQVLAMFLLAGLVPGTDIVVSPNQMFVVISLITGFILARLITPRIRHLTPRR